MFELVRFGCGGTAPCKVGCGGPESCKMLWAGGLDDAIRRARGMIDEDDPLSAVEVRADGRTLCTVGRGWISRLRPSSNAADA